MPLNLLQTDRFHPGDVDAAQTASELWGLPSVQTDAGVRIGPDTVFQSSVVWACVNLISTSMAQLRLHYVERTDTGRLARVESHPSEYLWNVSPDNIVPSSTWIEQFMALLLIDGGNAYAEIQVNRRNQAIGLTYLQKEEVEYVWDAKPRPFYRITDNGLRPRKVDTDRILHFRGRPDPETTLGMDVLIKARNTVGTELAAHLYSALFYRKGGRPPGFLTREGKFTDPQKKEIRKEWDEFVASLEAAFSVGLLSGGIEWKQMGFSPEQLQLLQNKKFQVEEVCRWFGMPANLIGHSEKTLYSGNLEQLSTHFVVYTLGAWIERLLGEMQLKLLNNRERGRLIPMFDARKLIQPELLNQAQAYEILHRRGIIVTNAVAEAFNLPAHETVGEKPLCDGISSMTTLEAVENGDNLSSNEPEPEEPEEDDEEEDDEESDEETDEDSPSPPNEDEESDNGQDRGHGAVRGGRRLVV